MAQLDAKSTAIMSILNACWQTYSSLQLFITAVSSRLLRARFIMQLVLSFCVTFTP